MWGDTMARTTLRMAAVVAGAALVLTGCGQTKGTGGDGSGGSASSGDDKATPAVALKLDKSPFCDKLDKQAMADALGVTKALTLTRQLRPGQKYVPFPHTPKQTATSWQCEFWSDFKGSDKPRVDHYASISAMPYTKESFAKFVKERTDPKYRDKGAVCENEESALVESASTGSSQACHKKTVKTRSTYAPGYSYITYRALVDASLVVCGAGSNTDTDFEQVKTAGKKLCTDFLGTVTK